MNFKEISSEKVKEIEGILTKYLPEAIGLQSRIMEMCIRDSSHRSRESADCLESARVFSVL